MAEVPIAVIDADRLVLLPFGDHGYRARETLEHVLWGQLRWFDEHVKGEGGEP